MKDLELRFTQKEDYSELSDWWDWWRWKDSKPGLELLDDLKYGLMVSNEIQNICAGFLYFTNAKAFGLLEFVISNPKIKNKDLRRESQIFLLSSLIVFARKQGVKVLFSSIRNPNLIKTYQECGFVIGSKNSNEMICKL
jgi:hypothetical protein